MITVNMGKAKIIGHEMRRAARADEFRPLDVQATIPSHADAAEAARQVIRDKYHQMQVAIDEATTSDEIKTALGV